MTGYEIGGYRITDKIGEGGMGAVYKAEHKLLGRVAAVKMLLPQLSHNREFVSRFFNEAKAATAIKHPGIVEIYDFGYHTDGTAYIVMELLEGESLEERIQRVSNIPINEVLGICSQVASALSAAHNRGIVHRDLKPDNLFLVHDPDFPAGERTKILDFGIAKLTDAQQDQPSVKTNTGSVLGTPTYMSPEQCKGSGGVDHRSDLYAVGCILYELVCGRPPFVADGAGLIMAQHIYQQPQSPRVFEPSISAELEGLINSLLEKEPSNRPRNAAALKVALDRCAGRTSASLSAANLQTVMAPSGTQTPVGWPTTTSTATGASNPRTVNWRSAVMPTAMLVTIAAGLSAFFLLRASANHGAAAGEVSYAPAVAEESNVPAPYSAATVARNPEPKPKLAPPAAPVRKPARITLTLTSDPSGAVVYKLPYGNRLGETPLDYETTPLDGTLEFVLKRSGYADKTVAVPAKVDIKYLVPLRKRRKRPTSRSSSSPSRHRPRPKKPAPENLAPNRPSRVDPFNRRDKTPGRVNPFDKPDDRPGQIAPPRRGE